MFDDLDDLLDDIPLSKKPQAKPSAAISLSKAKSSKPAEDEFDWDKPAGPTSS